MIEGSADIQRAEKLRYGMIGGGQGSFIGDVHRKSIALDGLAEIKAGCFSHSPENTFATGRALGIAQERLYNTFEEMAEEEAKRSDKIDFVVITTPNVSHYQAAKVFLNQGFSVVCDKPLAIELSDAQELAALSKKKGVLFCVTYTYTGNPTVKHARELVRHGEIGNILFVNAEYPQEWLLIPAEKQGSKQAQWRTDPKMAGKSNSVGDLGSHIENMIAYVTGLRIKSVLARLDTMGKDRVLDDNATIMLEYEGGAKGVYWTSQIAAGYDNGFRFRIFGTKGAIQWNEETSNYLELFRFGHPNAVLSRGKDLFYPHAQAYSRIPSGHPEGYFEALANIYKTYISALVKQKSGEPLTEEDLDFPNVDMGVEGVKFIEKCVESSQKGAVWIDYT
ncbi:MAG: Gfo/Idh/MocA family oxidoreductase [Treponema sp.]|jgi:predicted dehydrogenase|nr:Gfo/Idh/MocA family oxidoreductase [Treponema sp.]